MGQGFICVGICLIVIDNDFEIVDVFSNAFGQGADPVQYVKQL